MLICLKYITISNECHLLRVIYGHLLRVIHCCCQPLVTMNIAPITDISRRHNDIRRINDSRK